MLEAALLFQKCIKWNYFNINLSSTCVQSANSFGIFSGSRSFQYDYGWKCNKRWYKIVTNDISTMKKLPLVIRRNILGEKAIVGNWKFYKVVFKSIVSFNTKILPSLKIIGSNIREIEFNDCFSISGIEFQNILRCFPNSEKLTFDNCYFRYPLPKSDINILEIVNLNEVVLEQCNLVMLSCFQAQLKSLEVHMPAIFLSRTSGEVYLDQPLKEFLYKQKRLETLALSQIMNSSEVFAKKENAKFQFKLKKLSLRAILNNEEFGDANLKDFLLTQKDSVEILELGNTFSSDVYELILNKF